MFETKRHVMPSSGVVAERLVGHRWAEVRTADADVHDRPDRPACRAAPGAGADLSAISPIVRRTRCTSATTSWPSTSRRAPGGIRNATWSAARSSVVLMCSPANIASRQRLDTDAPGQRDERIHGLVPQPVLGVVEVEVTRLERHPPAAVGIRGEEFAQVRVAVLATLPGECAPLVGPRGVDRRDQRRFSSCPPKAFRWAERTLSAKSPAPCEPKRA